MYLDNNLFNPAWTTGSLSAVAPIVHVIGIFAMWVISIGGFFMVILPIIRNVINGIYVVAAPLCDKIDEAHKTKFVTKEYWKGQVGGGNELAATVGGITTVLLGLVPNFKALSDFESGIIDPKTWFIKAIPKMCIYVCIGVLIFYGYPSRIADKYSTAVTATIDVALNNIDPKAIIDRAEELKTFTGGDFASAEATDTLGKNTYALSKGIYGTMKSTYSDMSKDNLVSSSRKIEQWAESRLNQISDRAGSAKYKMQFDAMITQYQPETNKKAPWPSFAYDQDKHYYVYQTVEPMSTFGVDVPGGVDGHYLKVNLKFVELGASNGVTSVDGVATIPYESATTDDHSGKFTIKFRNKNGSVPWSLSSTVTINGYSATVTTNYDNTKGDLIILEFSSSDKLSKDKINAGTGSCNAIYARDSNGMQHTVTHVNFGGSEHKMTPNDSTRYDVWTPGTGAPEEKKVE